MSMRTVSPRLVSPLGRGIEPALSTIERLKRRADFLAAAGGRRFHTERMTAQGRLRATPADGRAESGLRVGFTITKRVGHATERNRIRRRLRDAVARADADLSCAKADIVLVARRPALHAPFETLIADLRRAVAAVTKPQAAQSASSAERLPARGRGKSKPPGSKPPGSKPPASKPAARPRQTAEGATSPSPPANACDGSTDG